jgi:hypothetical protein
VSCRVGLIHWRTHLSRGQHFECATYAGVAELDTDAAHDFAKAEGQLLKIGNISGKKILEIVRSGGIPADKLRKETPDDLAESWDGPNIDFVMGRWLENAAIQARKKIREASKTFDWT